MKTITYILAATCLFLAVLLWKKEANIRVMEKAYLQTSAVHLLAGAFEVNLVQSGQVETYFELMEQTFSALPEIVAENPDIEESTVEKTKEFIARYYAKIGHGPEKELRDFLGDYLNQEYGDFPFRSDKQENKTIQPVGAGQPDNPPVKL